MPKPAVGFAYRAMAAILRPPLMALTKRDWHGGEHLPPDEGFVLVTNHISYFDPLIVAHFIHDHGRAARFLAKDSLFRNPLLGRFLNSAGQIPVQRERRTAGDALQAACSAVERGECVVVYPDGTITRDPDLWPMVGKTGAVRIALRTGCDVIPVAHWGAQNVLLPYAKMPKLLPRKTMHVTAGPPVDLSAFRDRDLTPALFKKAAVKVTGDVTALLAQIRGVPAPEIRFDPVKADVPSVGNPYKNREGRR